MLGNSILFSVAAYASLNVMSCILWFSARSKFQHWICWGDGIGFGEFGIPIVKPSWIRTDSWNKFTLYCFVLRNWSVYGNLETWDQLEIVPFYIKDELRTVTNVSCSDFQSVIRRSPCQSLMVLSAAAYQNNVLPLNAVLMSISSAVQYAITWLSILVNTRSI